MKCSKRSLISILLLLILAGVLVIYILFDPAEAMWMPKCPTKTIFGISCPGCGSQRLVHALLHGDLSRAWRENAFILLALPYIAALALSGLFPGRCLNAARILQSMPVVTTFVILLILWTIIRNIYNC